MSNWLLDNIRLVSLLGDSCYSSGSVCPGVHIASMLAVFSALIQALLVWGQQIFCPNMIGQHYSKTSKIYNL